MERFAFKIDAALRANLYKICRLCGIDNPSKVPILPKGSEIIDLDEPSLSQKVQELVGFTVTKDDKMPQTMCSLCVDKINDFYEFREMCYATNKQTRNLLGLKQADPQKLMDIKPIFKSEPLAVTAAGKTRARKRKTEDVASETASGSAGKSSTAEIALDTVKNEPLTWRKKQRLQQQQQQLQVPSKADVKEEPIDADANNQGGLAGKKRRKASCSVCGERFLSKELAEEHKTVVHVPTILRYACHACNQTHNSPSDIKAHQLWHKLSKTPYQCPLCNVNVANNYAFTRHLREHTVPTPIELLVLDRECPMCKKTFLTNFFYNTHPCARRTRKCGGCSRALNTEVAYMKHAPHCSKIYLNHSKHIMPEVADNEAQMRIKNEFGVDTEENAMPSVTYPQENMQPVVVLERLSSPLLRASVAPNSLGKNSDRVSTKSYLKRVDQLLKNTMSTLVSIKHEPEVHIDDTGPLPGVESAESEPDEQPAGCDDFHFNAGNDESDEDVPATADAPTVAVKQEVVDESYEEQQEQVPSGDGVQIKQEPLKLKLKITKNHGQLNSSLVDDDHDPQSQSKSAKKKKKRKHKERNKESETSDKTTPTETNPDDIPTPAQATAEDSSNAVVTIKQERLDDNYDDVSTAQAEPQFEPQATVMTSIPMLQLDSSYSKENQAPDTRSSQEPEDVKPNRLELDRLMQITHVASGVAMAEEALPLENAVEALPSETQTEIPVKLVKKTVKKSTARKSTGGVPREVAKSSLSDSALDSFPREAATSSGSPSGSIPLEASTSSASSLSEMQLPQIVSVESGASVPFNMIAIKPEPLHRGYADEREEEEVAEANASRVDEINHNEKIDEETAYINSLDLSNVTIKQEKDLHISDASVNGSESDNLHFNGLHPSEDSEGDDDEDEVDDSASSEAEEHMDTYEEEEERIYREIELPPLEEQTPVDNSTLETQTNSENMQVESEESSKMAVGSKNIQMESVNMQVDPENIQETENVVQETPAIVEELNSAPAQSETEMTHIESGNKIMPADAPQDLQGEAKEPQLEEEIISTEPQQATTSASAFNFIITSVCSQAVEALPSNDGDANADNNLALLDTPQKSEDNEENITCPEVTLSAPKDNETLAQPFFTNSSSSTSYNCDEEQQNVLNHELAVTDPQELQQLAMPTVEEQEEPEAGPSATACNELAGNEGSGAHEETENRINEQQQQQQQQQQQRCEINDDSNINEIAENNNNANIERELNDDANVAQENPNI
ncbi:hypothetical protein ACLKA7_010662 [Drosophila subpalustris]